jgi:hypothetical protein
MADCRFVDPVAMHQLFHDRLGKELIEPQLVQCTLTSHRAQGCMAASHGHSSDRAAAHSGSRHYSTIA